MSELSAIKNNALIEAQEWSRERVDTLKRTVCRGASTDELELFIATAKRTMLSPEARQIFFVKGRGIQTSIDGFRTIAQRSGKYAGQVGPFWCGDDGVWSDIWLKSTPPYAAKVGVLRQDWSETCWGVARWSSYNQTNPMWKKMPDLMLAKCSESLALRKAFPNDLSGLYTSDEMAQAGKPYDAPIQAEPAIDIQALAPATARPDWDKIEAIMGAFGKFTDDKGGVRYLLEDYLGDKKIEAFDDADFIKLRMLYQQIRSGDLKLEDLMASLYAKQSAEKVSDIAAIHAAFE